MKVSKRISIILVILTVVTLTSISYFFAINKDNPNEDVLLKLGSRGTQVTQLQNKLKQQGYYKGSADGIYGKQTVAAVKSFQKAKKLKVDGIAGQKTLAALGLSGGKENNSGSSGGYGSNDEYLLARCIYAEARGEPYLGKVAVAAVVLNRVRSSQFPNTISGVIYQPLAFSSVNDGQINLTPDAEAKKAAKDAINGWDPTNGCIYFYNPVKSTSKWIFSRKVKLTIGKHRFAV